jgi:hypothetical protein
MELQTMWKSAWDELREFVWLASMVSGLSVFCVGLAIALALMLAGVA